MRYFFILLLLANIAFFVWSKRISPVVKTEFTVVDEGVEKLALIAEVEPNKPATTSEVTINSDVQQLCYSAGPFDVEANVHAARETLDAVVLKTNIRKITTTQEAGYWVYLPALSSRTEALKKGRELAAAFVKDYYVVTSGDNENSISLGLYRESFNADNRIAELSKKGFKVSKEIRIEQWPEFWLDFSITESQIDTLPDLKVNYPDISQNEVICKSN
ncbi:hypothetical protein OS175_10775 [Marinicella sp. S1101]|uniref:hypothetical protein n=1 Tax=Marinicella marina TaxID=2996016 RepID=UPI002260DA99|nr:hypothetical protein [Marinicella marina]MCX7554365.1 hypothetical protein [Marinicella marina]MDJ1138644.1 hypothetical protein [Marinicella marina]